MIYFLNTLVPHLSSLLILQFTFFFITHVLVKGKYRHCSLLPLKLHLWCLFCGRWEVLIPGHIMCWIDDNKSCSGAFLERLFLHLRTWYNSCRQYRPQCCLCYFFHISWIITVELNIEWGPFKILHIHTSFCTQNLIIVSRIYVLRQYCQ